MATPMDTVNTAADQQIEPKLGNHVVCDLYQIKDLAREKTIDALFEANDLRVKQTAMNVAQHFSKILDQVPAPMAEHFLNNIVPGKDFGPDDVVWLAMHKLNQDRKAGMTPDMRIV